MNVRNKLEQKDEQKHITIENSWQSKCLIVIVVWIVVLDNDNDNNDSTLVTFPIHLHKHHFNMNNINTKPFLMILIHQILTFNHH